MKNATRKFLLVLMALIMVLSLALTACEKNHDYTVKVVGADGKPYTSALVQPCVVDETKPGGLGTCYSGVATDENGVAYFDLGKEIADKSVNEIEVHLLDLPKTLTYTPVRMKKGETKTITLTEVSSGPVLKTPKSGTGTGSYEKDGSGEPTNSIDLDTFDPFVVVEGSYAFKFTSADQKIYYAFEPFDAGMYKVYSTGDIDASIIQLLGSKDYGLNCWRGEGYESDNVSDTDYNFSYEFEVEQGAIDGGLYIYFEVALEYEFDVDTEAVITFEYISEGQGSSEAKKVYPQEDFVYYAEPTTEYHDMPIDGTAKLVTTDYDNFYHFGDAYGPIVFANLGTDEALNDRHFGMSVTPNGLEHGFTQIVAQGASLVIEIDGKEYDYYPLAVEYTAHSNSSGRYPLTDELIDFFDNYLTIKYGIEWYEEYNNVTLPDENQWLVWCGYYEDASALEVEETADGTLENPYMLLDMNTVTVPAGGSVYYTYYTPINPTTLTVYSFTPDNIELTVYKNGEQPGAPLVSEWNATLSTKAYEVEIEAGVVYYFVFSTVDGEADEFWVFTQGPAGPKEGSWENPFELSGFGAVSETAEMTDNDEYESVFYTYTVTEYDEKLYIYLINNVVIRDLYYVDSSEVVHSLKDADITNGLQIPEGVTLWIEVSAVGGMGEFTFGLYNKVMGVENSPFWFEAGTVTIDVAAGGSVYYSVMPWWATKFILMSDSDNIKVSVYTDKENITVLKSEYDDSFYCTIEMEEFTTYYIVFTTADGNADKYSVLITEETPEEEPEEGTFENPLIMYFLDYYSRELDSVYSDVCYSYTVASDVSKIYFKCDENTNISVTYKDTTYFSWTPEDMAVLMAGLEVEAGETIMIIVSVKDPMTATSAEVGFTASSSPIND